MSIDVTFRIFDEDIKKWDKVKLRVLARYGRLRGKIGKGILDLAIQGIEHEKKEKNPVKHPKPSAKKMKRLVELGTALPEGRYSEMLIHKKLYERGLHSYPTIRSYINLLEGCGMIVYHHTEPGLNPHSSTRFFEKGKKENWADWVKAWIKKAGNEDSN